MVVRPQGRDAVAAFARQRHRAVPTACAPRSAGRAVAAVVTADRAGAVETQVPGLAAAREDLDHAADRVGAVEAGAGAAQDLDAVDLGQAQRVEVRQAERGRADPHAVDQQHRAGRRRRRG